MDEQFGVDETALLHTSSLDPCANCFARWLWLYRDVIYLSMIGYLSKYLLPVRRLIATSLHFTLSSAILVHSCSFSPLQFLTLSFQLSLGLPLGLVHSTLPSNISFKRLWCLLTWPKYLTFLSLTNYTSAICLRPAMCNISLLVFIRFQDIFIILL